MALLPKAKSRPYEGPECPLCTSTLPASAHRSGAQVCEHCKREFSGTWFPPLDTPAPARPAGVAGPDGVASCARHAGNAAETSCGRCGSFICSLCRVDSDGRILCTSCFERLSADGALWSTMTTAIHWGSRARTFLIAGFLLSCVAPLFGIGALYCARKGIAVKRASGETAELSPYQVMTVLSVLYIASALIWVPILVGAVLE